MYSLRNTPQLLTSSSQLHHVHHKEVHPVQGVSPLISCLHDAPLADAQYHLEPNIFVELPVGVRRVMPLVSSQQATDTNDIPALSFAVTPMDANHCPGSVCLLFEGYFGRFLCTGDFRFRRGLFDGHDVVDVGRLYLDDTYCAPHYDRFLTETQCARHFADIVRHRSNAHCRFMVAVDTLGKEKVFVRLAALLRTRIVVNAERYRRLQALLEDEHLADAVNVARFFTRSAEDGVVFMVNKREISLRNLDRLNERLWRSSQRTETQRGQAAAQFVGILPSGWSIHKNPLKTSTLGSRLFTVPYSAHSSFSELCAAVRYVRPRSVIPIVADTFSRCPRCFADYLSAERPRLFAVPPLIGDIIMDGATR